jgi:hypothetical protein
MEGGGGGEGDELPEFLASEGAEPPLKRCRAPCDERAYDSEGEEGPCFASLYQADAEEDGEAAGAADGEEPPAAAAGEEGRHAPEHLGAGAVASCAPAADVRLAAPAGNLCERPAPPPSAQRSPACGSGPLSCAH